MFHRAQYSTLIYCYIESYRNNFATKAGRRDREKREESPPPPQSKPGFLFRAIDPTRFFSRTTADTFFPLPFSLQNAPFTFSPSIFFLPLLALDLYLPPFDSPPLYPFPPPIIRFLPFCLSGTIVEVSTHPVARLQRPQSYA